MHILLVGVGGFPGSVLRYVLAGRVHDYLNNAWFPYGTLTVNVLGCFLMGFLTGLWDDQHMASQELRVFFLVGFLGGFTTFSAFSYETFALMRSGEMVSAGMNVMGQLILGILGVWFGFILAK